MTMLEIIKLFNQLELAILCNTQIQYYNLKNYEIFNMDTCSNNDELLLQFMNIIDINLSELLKTLKKLENDNHLYIDNNQILLFNINDYTIQLKFIFYEFTIYVGYNVNKIKYKNSYASNDINPRSKKIRRLN